MKLIVCTSARENMRKCLEYCLLSVDSYRRNVIPELSSLGEIIPGNYGRQPGWFKVPQIKKLLPDFDYVLCVDADTMFIGKQDIRELIQPFTLNIAQDKNGINCGVMAWKNCPESFAALDHIEASYERYCNDAWQEQRVLTNMISEKRLDVCYQTKHIWNAYPYPYEFNGFTDEAPDSLIIHYASVSIPERERLMEERCNGLR